MRCPVSADGVHRIEGKPACACGYVLVIPPICVSIEVTNRSEVLVSDGFNCNDISVAIAALRSAADELESSSSPTGKPRT